MDLLPLAMAAGVALIVGILAAWVGYLIGHRRAGQVGVSSQAELGAARQQLDGMRQAIGFAQSETSTRVADERQAGVQRLAEARADFDRRLASSEAAAENRLTETRQRAEEQQRHDHSAFESRLADERGRGEQRLVELRAEHERQVAQAAIERSEREAAFDAALVQERERGLEQLEEAKTAGVDAVARERQRAAEQLDEIRADHKRLEEQFEALSKRALEQNTKQFLEQAEERLKRAQGEGAAELQKRQDAVEQLVEPMKVTLETVKAEVVVAEKARLEANATLYEQIAQMRRSSDSLNAETAKLVNALRAPQVRGRWGEMQLRRVVEAAGMLNHVDFFEQEHHANDEGGKRPDMVVHLADQKRVVVDSKVAFSGYLEAMEATEEAARTSRLQAHARHLKKHIDDLGTKEYWDAVGGSPEFIVMFVPAEPFLTAALDQDATLFEHAFSKNVVIATPSTLMALLRTVGHVWRQEQLAAEAQEIFSVGKDLHKRLGVLGGHLVTLGKRINLTVEGYNRLAGSLDRNVVTQARRFSALQGLQGGLDALAPVEALAAPPQKNDLYGETDEFEAVLEATLVSDESNADDPPPAVTTG